MTDGQVPWDPQVLKTLRSRHVGRVESLLVDLRRSADEAEDLDLETRWLNEARKLIGRYKQAAWHVAAGRVATIEAANKVERLGQFFGLNDDELHEWVEKVKTAEPENIAKEARR